VIVAGLGLPLGSVQVRVNGQDVKDKSNIIKYIPPPINRQEDDAQQYNGSLAGLRAMTFIYKSNGTQRSLELPLGYFVSLYVSQGKIENIICSPYIPPLNLQQTIDLIVLLEDRLRGANWRAVSERSERDFLPFFTSTQTDRWRYMSAWINEEKDLVEIRCERKVQSSHIVFGSVAPKVRFLVGLHFNRESITLV
jgi:hypothetical protein